MWAQNIVIHPHCDESNFKIGQVTNPNKARSAYPAPKNEHFRDNKTYRYLVLPLRSKALLFEMSSLRGNLEKVAWTPFWGVFLVKIYTFY